MLDKYICHFWGVGPILSLSFYFPWKILLTNNIGPDQTSHNVTSDQGLYCLPTNSFMGFQVRMGESKY